MMFGNEEHLDTCNCEECQLEKNYLINLVCSSVEERKAMSLPYAIDCTNGQGIRQSHDAEGYIVSPTGRRIGAICSKCAQEIIDEYKDKLGQVWTFERQEWQPVPRVNEPDELETNEKKSIKKEKKLNSLPYSRRLAGLLASSCADLHDNEHPFYGSTISPDGLAGKISEAIQEILTVKDAKSEIPFYVDPVHSTVSILGKLGGQDKSEVKSMSSRENGRKGGRPKKQKEITIQLDMEDI